MYIYFKGYGKLSILLPVICVIVFNISLTFGIMGYLGKSIKGIFECLLQGIWETIHFTSRNMEFCVQYFVYFRGYGILRGLNQGDICMFTSRDMVNHPFYFQEYGLLCSIFFQLSGLWDVQRN